MEKIIAVWNMLPKWLRKFITGTGDKIKTFTVTVIENTKEGLSNILVGGTDGTEGGTDEENPLVGGMISALEEYREKAQDVAGQVKEAMTNALQGMENALVKFVMTG